MELCKFIFEHNIVLIETLWNVKMTATDTTKSSVGVLIETLWNVKFIVSFINLNQSIVLIETLWNVNFCLTAAKQISGVF